MKRWIHAATDNQPSGGAHWERGSGDLAAFEWYIDNETEKLLGIIEEAWRSEEGGYCAYARLGENRSDDKFLGRFDTRKEAERAIVDFYGGGSIMRANEGDQMELVMESTDVAASEDILKWYSDPADYPDIDPERFALIPSIDWDINSEDVECVLSDPTPLDNVARISYVDDATFEDLEESGYDGGYLFTYKDGTSKVLAWRPYPNNMAPLTEVEEYNIRRYK